MKYYISYIASKKYTEMDSVILIRETYDNISKDIFTEIIDGSCKRYMKHLYIEKTEEISKEQYEKLGKVDLATTLHVCNLNCRNCRKERIRNFFIQLIELRWLRKKNMA